MQQKIIQSKHCKHCNTPFDISDTDLEFYEKVSPVIWWVKYNIPTPTLCPDCRQQRRFTFRNERKLYKRKCDFSWKDIVSIYSPDKPYKVYDNDVWWSDKWNSLDYWKDYNFKLSAFDQFDELMKKVPFQKSFTTISCENSEYGNHTGELKDCFLCFATWASENTHYSTRTTNTKDSLDLLWADKLSNCYQCVWCINSNKCFYSKNCSDSYNLISCIDCVWCSDCILCTNLNWKKYCIENKQYSKEEYFVNKKLLIKKIFKEWWNSLKEIESKMIHKNLDIINSQNCLGDNISNCKNSYYVFDVADIQDCKYGILSTNQANDVYDATWFWAKLDKWYEIVDVWLNWYLNCFCIVCHNNSNIFYSLNCYNSNNLFLCIWLKNKSFCILNKQYTKEEYEKLVPKIIEHMIKTWEWWEFFPSSLSPFTYNETIAMEYFPLIKENAKEKWFNWSDYEASFPKVEKVIKANMLPDDIKDIPDDILNWAIESEIESTEGFNPLYRIIAQELEFYRKHNLPIPKRHPDQRHLDRMSLRNPRKLFDRKCDKCRTDIKSSYSPERPEKVYCEDCYNKEVY